MKQSANMLVPTAVYGAVISAMPRLSATVPFSIPGGPLLLAAALFADSDGLPVHNIFHAARAANETSFLRHCRITCHQLTSVNWPLDWSSLCCYFVGKSPFAAGVFVL